MLRLGSKTQAGWATLAVCCFLNGSVTAESAPADHWACLQPGAQPLPRYWRLVASESTAVNREIRLYERDADDSDATQACRVEYVRRGETRVLWFANHQRDYCRPRAEALVGRLKAGGLNCIALDSSDRLQPSEHEAAEPEQPVAPNE